MTESKELFFSILPIFIIRSGFAILCGALIGIERERKGKPAGFRTNTLICLGSCLYMLVSEFIFQRVGTGSGDLTRIASQVVTGIGFLGAGTIIQSRGTITGLTSAATIWVVAGIGLFIGAGFPWLGLLCTILVFFSLVVLAKIEPKLLGKCHFVECEILFSDDGGRTRAELASTLAEHDIDISALDFSKVDNGKSRLKLSFCDKHPSHGRYIAELWRVSGIVEVTKAKSNSNHIT
ncbi:MAG: MgtC/SapB family protein [Ignavibacteriae bacterium]|nr:MgtC/SapB family protein [Ignavibacteria bacterium]MBI3363305.1 MgtC/SapB family protein [Ignavibacteriota bacterium]